MNQYKDLPQSVCGGMNIGGGMRDRCSLADRPRADKAHGFGLTGREPAALYLPLQSFTDLYEIGTALSRGTLFRGLDKPFLGAKEGCCRGQQR